MTEVRFYHLERQTLEEALPGLLMKALDNGHKIIVRTKDAKEAERLNEYLWVYNPGQFLPHGTKKDGFADKQPVWLTEEEENPNGADVLVLTSGADMDLSTYKLCCDMLDGRDSAQVEAARQRWKTYKDRGYSVTYWQQGPKGWEKK